MAGAIQAILTSCGFERNSQFRALSKVPVSTASPTHRPVTCRCRTRAADTATVRAAPAESAGRKPGGQYGWASTNRLTPYVQNFNFEIQRELPQNLTLNVAYVGTKGTKLYGGIPLNTVNIFKNEFLDAFNITRTGGNAPLFDQMLKDSILGAGVVNGTTVTGSAALRANTSTRAFIANGNVGGLADFLNRSTNITGQGGGFVRNSGLFPENFFVLNPQFNSVDAAIRIQATPRTTPCKCRSPNGCRTASPIDLLHMEPRSGRKRWRTAPSTIAIPTTGALNKALLGFHRTHPHQQRHVRVAIRTEPSVSQRAPGLVQRLVERWQFGGIFSWLPERRLNITAPVVDDHSDYHQSAHRTSLEIFPRASGRSPRWRTA